MAILTVSATPTDSLGSAGDYALDATNKFLWGPKTTTWAGTAESLTGPSGPGLLYGQGAPTSNQGVTGQGYCDLATGNLYGPKQSNGAWGTPVSQIQGAVGPQGLGVLTGSGTPLASLGANGQVYIDTSTYMAYSKANGAWGSGTSLAGPSYLTGMAAGVGSYAIANAQAISATPYVLVLPGTSMASTYTPVAPSALMGFYCYSSIAITLQLYDATAGAVVYTQAVTAGQSFNSGYLATTACPLVQGHTYQWQATGSAATAQIQVEPFYLMPANSPGVCVGMAGPTGFSANQTFSSTAVNLPPLGLPASFGTWIHVPPRTGGIYSAQATYTPASGTASTASVTLSLKYHNLTTTSAGTVAIAFSPVTATGLPQTILTPQLTDLTSLTVGNYFYFTATGSGTGTLSVTLFPLV